VRILVTSARMPFALAVIRRLSQAGHAVFSSDTYEAAPGNHSRYVNAHAVTASPRGDTERFVEQVADFCSEREVDVIVPTWEEAFYLSTAGQRLEQIATLYAPPFEKLARVHDKHSFQRLVEGLGIRSPEGVTVRSDEELSEAISRWPRYFGRGVYSRGGVTLLTNTGPLAGHVRAEDVHPTPDAPWLVQEFVDGPMVCTYSTLHGGRVTAHCTYRGPRQYHHSTAVQFESIPGDESLEVVQRLGSALDYTGQMSLDFVQSDDGLVIIECNPRTTDGALLMESDELAGGLLDADQELAMVPPGRITQLDLALVGAMFSDGLREVPGTIHDLLRIPGADRGWHDELPNLYSFLAFCHHERLSLREHQKLQVAMYEDVSWDGEPIEGMSPAQSAALASLHGRDL
jgi:glutathione synthase/RimK-type ligase-like ATP-grasp enzyme